MRGAQGLDQGFHVEYCWHVKKVVKKGRRMNGQAGEPKHSLN